MGPAVPSSGCVGAVRNEISREGLSLASVRKVFSAYVVMLSSVFPLLDDWLESGRVITTGSFGAVLVSSATSGFSDVGRIVLVICSSDDMSK